MSNIVKNGIEYTVGTISAVVSGAFMGFVVDALTALLFGALGAMGALLFNRLLSNKISECIRRWKP